MSIPPEYAYIATEYPPGKAVITQRALLIPPCLWCQYPFFSILAVNRGELKVQSEHKFSHSDERLYIYPFCGS